jgi:hypothetical protein
MPQAANIYQPPTLLPLARNLINPQPAQLLSHPWQNNPSDLLSGPTMTIPVVLLQRLLDHTTQLSAFSSPDSRLMTENLLNLIRMVTLQQNNVNHLATIFPLPLPQTNTGYVPLTSNPSSASSSQPTNHPPYDRISHHIENQSTSHSRDDSLDHPISSASTSRRSPSLPTASRAVKRESIHMYYSTTSLVFS